MKKFPSIGQFRNVIKELRDRFDYKGKDEQGDPIYKHDEDYPTLKFKGTIKLHGTNAGIVFYKNGNIQFQSRENVLSLEKDNAGFMTANAGKSLNKLIEGIQFEDYIAIYGEWCGGNIQKGVALNQLPKMFVIFSVIVDDKPIEYTKSIPEELIYNINDFQTFDIEINFNTPELSQNQLIDWTLKVEEECPFAKHFGISGVGEGIVFQSIDYPTIRFKSKGEKHSASKVKVLNSVNEEEVKSYNDFVEYACTENRLKQGLENIPAKENKYTGDFIRWVANDILKEESDTLIANKIEWKKVAGLIANKSRVFFLNQI